jgi:hypothetical protein
MVKANRSRGVFEWVKIQSPLLVLLVWIQFIFAPAMGQYYTGPVASGVGGAGRASNEPTESVMLNPAAIAHAESVRSGLFYTDGHYSKDSRESTLAVHIVDNNEDALFPGALGYIQRRAQLSDVMGPFNERVFLASVGNFFYQQVAMGFAIQQLRTEIPRGKSYDQWNGNVGLHWNPHPDLGLAFVYYNLVPAPKDTPEVLQLKPQQSWGMNYIAADFVRLRLDVSRWEKANPDKELLWQGGFESFLSDFIILRVGYEQDQRRNRSFLTTGLGFDGPRFKFDYSFKKRQGEASSALHSVDLRVPFW